jgi:hypothetical protein
MCGICDKAQCNLTCLDACRDAQGDSLFRYSQPCQKSMAEHLLHTQTKTTSRRILFFPVGLICELLAPMTNKKHSRSIRGMAGLHATSCSGFEHWFDCFHDHTGPIFWQSLSVVITAVKQSEKYHRFYIETKTHLNLLSSYTTGSLLALLYVLLGTILPVHA